VFFVGRLAAIVLVASVAAGGFEQTLDPRAMEQAIAIGVSRIDADRSRFHRSYRIDINRPPIDWIDIVTPFRRVVLDAEARTRAGARLYGQREALEALGVSPEQVDIIVELTFHPLNTFVGVPAYEVVLVGRDGRVTARDVDRVSRFGPRMGSTALPYPWNGSVRIPRGSEPLLGGTVVARFDGRTLAADGAYDVVIGEMGKELVRTRVNLAAVR
jgi:hypothetical protein